MFNHLLIYTLKDRENLTFKFVHLIEKDQLTITLGNVSEFFLLWSQSSGNCGFRKKKFQSCGNFKCPKMPLKALEVVFFSADLDLEDLKG